MVQVIYKIGEEAGQVNLSGNGCKMTDSCCLGNEILREGHDFILTKGVNVLLAIVGINGY